MPEGQNHEKAEIIVSAVDLRHARAFKLKHQCTVLALACGCTYRFESLSMLLTLPIE